MAKGQNLICKVGLHGVFRVANRKTTQGVALTALCEGLGPANFPTKPVAQGQPFRTIGLGNERSEEDDSLKREVNS